MTEYRFISEDEKDIVLDLADHISKEVNRLITRMSRTAPHHLQETTYLASQAMVMDNIEYLRTKFSPHHTETYDSLMAILVEFRKNYVKKEQQG